VDEIKELLQQIIDFIDKYAQQAEKSFLGVQRRSSAAATQTVPPTKAKVLAFVQTVQNWLDRLDNNVEEVFHNSKEIEEVGLVPQKLSMGARTILSMNLNFLVNEDFEGYMNSLLQFYELVVSLASSTSSKELQALMVSCLKNLLKELIDLIRIVESVDQQQQEKERENQFTQKNKLVTIAVVHLMNAAKRGVEESRLPCDQCGNPIRGSYSVAEGKNYCKSCFVCETCKEPLTRYILFEDKFYCQEHYQLQCVAKCSKCALPVFGEFMQMEDGRKWHVNCFSCSTCNTLLSGEYFEIRGELRCSLHIFEPSKETPSAPEKGTKSLTTNNNNRPPPNNPKQPILGSLLSAATPTEPGKRQEVVDQPATINNTYGKIPLTSPSESISTTNSLLKSVNYAPRPPRPGSGVLSSSLRASPQNYSVIPKLDKSFRNSVSWQSVNVSRSVDIEQQQQQQLQLQQQIVAEQKPVSPQPPTNSSEVSSKSWHISFSELKLKKELGEGAFGIVYKGVWRSTSVAIKLCNGQLSTKVKEDFIKEAEIMM
jgi:hypothetical protein